jgi:hypothetical protein
VPEEENKKKKKPKKKTKDFSFSDSVNFKTGPKIELLDDTESELASSSQSDYFSTFQPHKIEFPDSTDNESGSSGKGFFVKPKVTDKTSTINDDLNMGFSSQDDTSGIKFCNDHSGFSSQDSNIQFTTSHSAYNSPPDQIIHDSSYKEVLRF